MTRPPLDDSGILDEGRNALRIEAEAVSALASRLDDSFVKAVRLIDSASGKVIFTGIGKSGLVASKLAATFSSVGVPAAFLHPTEGAHGDLGILSSRDVVVALSKSGETSELLQILPIIRRIGASLVAVVGNTDSTLARKADVVLDCSVRREACPFDLAPTASTTAALALGDAIAVALMRLRRFTPEQFAVYHPAGSLGRRLLLSVRDLMHSGPRNPVLPPYASAADVIDKLSETRLGAVNVVDSDGRLLGIITDGDVRRKIRLGEKFFRLTAADMMTPDPVTVSPDASADEAYRKMEYRESQIAVLPVVDERGRAIGVVRLHDVVGGGKE